MQLATFQYFCSKLKTFLRLQCLAMSHRYCSTFQNSILRPIQIGLLWLGYSQVGKYSSAYMYTSTNQNLTFEPQICLFSGWLINSSIYMDTNTIRYMIDDWILLKLKYAYFQVLYEQHYTATQILSDIWTNTQICLYSGWLHIRDHQVWSSLRVQQSETPRQVGRAQNHQVRLPLSSPLSSLSSS